MTEYQLKLPFRCPPPALWGNQRKGHWGARASDTKVVRHAVMTLARQARIPKADHLTVELIWAPGDWRRRDEDNLALMLKACCDGLARGPRKASAKAAPWVGLDLVPDDTPRYMAKAAYILSPDEIPAMGMWLIVTTGAPRRRPVPPPDRRPPTIPREREP
uniref:hypothetical protein n=1 Tax=Pseudonocardia sp. CA-138482 TaxID=3240023 RepID=UPI003F492DCE